MQKVHTFLYRVTTIPSLRRAALLAILLTTISSCSSVEIERIEKRVIAYDQSRPLPQNSGLKVKLGEETPGILFQPGKDPEQVLIQPGTYALIGVEVYRRMYSAVTAIKAINGDLTQDQRKAFLAAQQAALSDLDKE